MSAFTYNTCIFLCLVFLQNVYSDNILFISVIPSISHQRAFQPIWKELSLRGHSVHAVTTAPLEDPSLTNLTEYDVSSLKRILTEAPKDVQMYILRKPDFLTVFLKDIFMTKGFSMLSELAFQHEEIQKLLNKDLTFDVAVIEWLFPTMSAFGAKYKCPIVGISSLGAPLVALDTVGNPSHPITAPDHNLPVTRDMPFRERLMSALYSVYVRFWYHAVVLPREDKLIKKYLGEDMPYIGDIERNVSVLLLNRNPVFHRVMPFVPAVIELGTIALNRSRPELEPDLKQFMDGSKKGVIYFSLGSNMKSIYLPNHFRDIFLPVFEQLPYNVVLKWENDTLPGKPKNVFIAKWLPQLTVLEHPNTKLFITQGGLQSAEEAILAKVPIIGFPTHSDQTVNIDAFAKYGVGIALDLDYVTVDTFNASIYEVMTKPSYKENAKRLSGLMYDQPIDGLQRAVWWIEYVSRHKGARNLRSPILDIPWWQYLMVDVIGFLLFILILVLSIFYLAIKGVIWLLRKVLRLVLSPIKSKKVVKKKAE